MANGCEFDFMEYIDENGIDPNLICSICHKPFKDPVCTPCDHTYGRACITHWLTTSINFSCPTCVQQPLLLKDLIPASRLLSRMLDPIQVRCTLCEQTGLQRGNFVDHINKTCPKALVQCQAADIKCPWKGPRDESDSHVSACVFEPLRPVLATLIADNQQLTDQVRNHDHQIKDLTKKLAQLNNDAASDSDEESDTESFAGATVGDSSKTENTIYIQNLPSTVKHHEIFGIFQKVGRVKYNSTNQKPNIFIFNKLNKNGHCAARVTFVDKESVAAAIAEFNHKHIPQWNTHLRVSKFIPDPSRRNVTGGAQGKNENIGAQQNTKAAGAEQPQSPNEQNPGTPKRNRRARKQHSGQGDKTKTEN